MEWLNYHHLYYFWSVARAGSIVRASAELRLAQPTISNQLKTLESMVIADVPASEDVKVKAFSHRLGDCGTSFFAAAALAHLRKGFPRSRRPGRGDPRVVLRDHGRAAAPPPRGGLARGGGPGRDLRVIEPRRAAPR